MNVRILPPPAQVPLAHGDARGEQPAAQGARRGPAFQHVQGHPRDHARHAQPRHAQRPDALKDRRMWFCRGKHGVSLRS